MRSTAIGVGVLCAIALMVFNSPVLYAQSQSGSITVQRGDTLSELAFQHGATVKGLVKANTNITNPDLIYSGQRLQLPNGNGSHNTAASSASAGSSSGTSTAATRPPAVANATTSSSVWDRLAQCESSGDWSINTGNGFYGGLQFTLSSWRAVGGSGYPHHASKQEQIHRAKKLQSIQGWGAWPACTSQLGIR